MVLKNHGSTAQKMNQVRQKEAAQGRSDLRATRRETAGLILHILPSGKMSRKREIQSPGKVIDSPSSGNPVRSTT